MPLYTPPSSSAASVPYFCYRDEKASGTAPQSFTAGGTWDTRTLNTEQADTAGIGSLASNQVTLPAGTYVVQATAPAGNSSGQHQTRLRNVTDSTTLVVGTSEDAQQTGKSFIVGSFTLGSSKALEVQHRASTAVAAGDKVTFGEVEAYTVVEFWKIA